MENEIYNDDFELLLKERADEFRMYPSKRVWYSIYNNIHPGRRWPSIVMSLLLIAGLLSIGYLNTGENSITQPINNDVNNIITKNNSATTFNSQKQADKKQVAVIGKTEKTEVASDLYNHAFDDVITNETDFHIYTIVKSNRPLNFYASANSSADKSLVTIEKSSLKNEDENVIQVVDTYIKSNKIFADVAANNKKNQTLANKNAKNNNSNTQSSDDDDFASLNKTATVDAVDLKAGLNKSTNGADVKTFSKIPATDSKKSLTNDEKEWIENYVFDNKSAKNKWKERTQFEFYITPAVNYRKLSTKSKGSSSAFATADINDVISQRPGLGLEAGLGIHYNIASRLQFKAGVQFNYTSYNIAANETNHPVVTTILLNDPSSGYSYISARTSSTSNIYSGSNAQPVTLHNRTYQVSVPIGLAYKLSSNNHVDWYAGGTVQPTYVFGGKANIISTDLKNYVSEPSSIRTWNLNLGFETYMNYKLGSYNLQVGPQVRYQVFSTYRRGVALIEKPYAIGLKFGLVKGF